MKDIRKKEQKSNDPQRLNYFCAFNSVTVQTYTQMQFRWLAGSSCDSRPQQGSEANLSAVHPPPTTYLQRNILSLARINNKPLIVLTAKQIR